MHSRKFTREFVAIAKRMPSTSSFDVDAGIASMSRRFHIFGNTRTLDKVIRREFRLVEGDAFNRVLVDRPRTRIKGLGYSRTSTSSRRRIAPDRTI